MVKEHIERDGLVEKLKERKHCITSNKIKIDEVISLINSEPTADVQEVVRCGFCKHYKLRGGAKWCVLNMVRMHSDDFCSYGAKMDKE